MDYEVTEELTRLGRADIQVAGEKETASVHMACVEKDLMNQSPDTDQLNVGTRERKIRMGPKFLPRVFGQFCWQRIP